ncbi:MAG: PSP1 domain-containing protein [Saccharofermentanales bacterium]|jgi:cell fate regulator YaaT (PSP1 superfamily)
MTNVVSIRLHGRGKVYYFDPQDLELHTNDAVIVETSQGVDLGFCTGEISGIDISKFEHELKPVMRKATEEDLEHFAENLKIEAEAFEIAKQKIMEHELNMRLVDVECMFDNQRIIFYFTADGRIDFRDLVKDLASVFRLRIELRQIGVRDEARLIGGLGVCGQELCCCSFLQDFYPVSIKMAKQQNLAMNPAKISGACGRLLCCLQYEHDAYVDAYKRMPKIGQIVQTPLGQGKVASVNLLKETARVYLEIDGDTETKTFKYEELNQGQNNCRCSQRLDRD